MMSSKKIVGMVLAVLSFFLMLRLPPSQELSEEAIRCLALFSAVFFLYLFESVHAAVVSLMIVPLLTVLHVTGISEALSGFASTSTYLIVGSFILAAAVVESGLGTRLTYWILLRVGTGARNITMGVVLVNIAMAFMIPSSTARTAMLLPICMALDGQFSGGQRGTRFGTNLMLTLCTTNSTISAGILTATITNPLAVEYIQNASGETVSFYHWLLWGFPPALVLTFLSWLVIQLMYPPERRELAGGRDYIAEKLRALGPLSLQEKKTAAVLVLTIALWALGNVLGIDSTSACLLGACLLLLPKVGALDWDVCRKHVSLSVIFVVSGGISLGAAMSSTGAAAWIAEKVFSFPGLQSLPPWTLILVLLVITQFLHVFFAGTATMANVLFPILLGIASAAGIDAAQALVPVAMVIGGYPLLMFFNTTPGIMCYDTGEVRASDFPRTGIPISVAVCIVYALCILFYWPATGLF